MCESTKVSKLVNSSGNCFKKLYSLNQCAYLESVSVPCIPSKKENILSEKKIWVRNHVLSKKNNFLEFSKSLYKTSKIIKSFFE